MRLVFCIGACVLMLYVLVFIMSERERFVDKGNRGRTRRGNDDSGMEKIRKAYGGRRKDVACAAPRWATATGSYMIRCTLLALQMNGFGSGRVHIIATTFEEIEDDDDTVYHATIAIKVRACMCMSRNTCTRAVCMPRWKKELCCVYGLLIVSSVHLQLH